MTKQEFFNDLQDIVTDKIFIGSSVEEIKEESNNNLWSISVSQELCQELKIEDLTVFFDKIIRNREQQVKDSKYNHGMIFYLWFESMSGRLRFNLISDFHKKLPFKCELIEVDDIKDIIIDFLNYKYHDGLPIAPDEKGSTQLNIEGNINELNVFKKYLPK